MTSFVSAVAVARTTAIAHRRITTSNGEGAELQLKREHAVPVLGQVHNNPTSPRHRAQRLDKLAGGLRFGVVGVLFGFPHRMLQLSLSDRAIPR
jgi:hypothetical protein